MRRQLFLACLDSAYAGYREECYQCAYNPEDVTVDQIRVSRIVYDEIRVPRTVYHEAKVPRVVHHGITVCMSRKHTWCPWKILYDQRKRFQSIDMWQKCMLNSIVNTDPTDTGEMIDMWNILFSGYQTFKESKKNKLRNTIVNENYIVSWQLCKIHSLWWYYDESYPSCFFTRENSHTTMVTNLWRESYMTTISFRKSSMTQNRWDLFILMHGCINPIQYVFHSNQYFFIPVPS